MLFSISSSDKSSISVWYSEILFLPKWVLGGDHLLIEWEQIEQVEAYNSWFLLWRRDDTFELVVVRAENTNIALKLRDVFLLHRQESCILINFSSNNALFRVTLLAWWDILEVCQVNHQLGHGWYSLLQGFRCLCNLLEPLEVISDAGRQLWHYLVNSLLIIKSLIKLHNDLNYYCTATCLRTQIIWKI